MSTFPVRLDVEFSDDDIDLNIFLSGAFRWEWWYSVNHIEGGVQIEAESPDGDDMITKTITPNDIRRVMGNLCADAYPDPQYYSLAKKQIMDGIRTGDFDFDACGADEIIQIAMFGKVVYS